MTIPSSLSSLFCGVLLLSSVAAYDPTLVDGKVTVEVDRSEAVWKVTVSNQSEELIRYEMMGQVPRGLGLEVWAANPDQGFRVHAEDLADYLDVDGFPADLRELPAGQSVEFRLNPRSMSTTTGMAEGRWKRVSERGYYDCRVFFGGYASHMMSISPKSKGRRTGADEERKRPPAWLDAESDKPFGMQLREELNEKGLALVDWHRGSDRGDDYYIRYRTCQKSDLERMPVWEGSKVIEPGMPALVSEAHEQARKHLGACTFEGLMMDPCADAPGKFAVGCWFVSDNDDVTITRLLNGASTEHSRLVITKAQFEELEEYGVPVNTR